MKKLPDESCRNCGLDLRVLDLCGLCFKPTKHFCPTCHLESQEHYHLKCNELFTTSEKYIVAK